MDIEEENATLVHRARGTENSRDPLVKVISFGPRAAVGGRVQGDGPQLLLDPLGRGGERLGHLRGAFLLL